MIQNSQIGEYYWFQSHKKARIGNLREDSNSTNLGKLMNEKESLSFAEQILKTFNIMCQMTNSYIKKVGNLLVLISFVGESTTKQHL